MSQPTERLLVLIIEDDFLQNQLLTVFVESAGYDVITADNGASALSQFHERKPDVVLLDYELPDMSGKQIVVQLRELQTEWLPILFLSAHHDIEVQRDCLRSGGDDFITKPLDFPILEAKIQALCRLALMQRKIREQSALLQAHIAQEEAEAAAAHYLYERMITPVGKVFEGCQQLILPATQFSGDMICTGIGTNGHVYLLLADATGHGLSAAIGLIPVTQVFHSMTNKGHHISTIAREMNRQIRQFTPVYRFVAAVLVEIDPFESQIEVWNGGMPTGHLYQPTAMSLRHFVSRHVAFGLDSDDQFNADVDHARYLPGDQLLFFSDGLTDAESPTGERFGEDQVEHLFGAAGKRKNLAGFITALRTHLQDAAAHDDVAIALIDLPGPDMIAVSTNQEQSRVELAPCELDIRLQDALIASFDLLPTAVEWLRRVGVPQTKIARLHTVLMELVTNAVDHGLLRLDSALKEGPDGFTQYFHERLNRLSALHGAELRLQIRLDRQDEGFLATVRVSDTGPGFDLNRLMPDPETALELKSGRGIQLVRVHTRALRYLGNGNQVEAEIWL